MKPELMRRQLVFKLCALAMLVFADVAQAGVTCAVTSGGFTAAYGSLLNVNATTFTVTCTKGPGNPKTATYQVQATGAHALGAQNRAFLSPNYLNYNLTSDNGCSALWGGTTYIPAAPYTTPALSNNGQQDVKTYSFYGCVPANQSAVTAGTYADTVTMTLIPTNPPGGVTFNSGTFPVSIYAPATCSITTPPGNINFSYTSFGPAANASTTFAATCTNLLPYTMSLDATSGMIVGINYTLALSSASGTGTGSAQTYSINGAIAAGQGGTCAATSCTGSQTRTLTITY